MKQRLRTKPAGLLLPVFLLIAAKLLSAHPAVKYPALLEFIEKTRFIDVHAHPSLAHLDYKKEDPYPTLEPPISRPFWPIPKDRIAVFDTLQPEALKAIYGYNKDTVTEKDGEELRKLSQKFWQAGPGHGLIRVLDASGIDKVFANTSAFPQGLDPARVAWVPFIDLFFYPFAAPLMRDVAPDLKESLGSYSREVRAAAEKHNKELGYPLDSGRYNILCLSVSDDHHEYIPF